MHYLPSAFGLLDFLARVVADFMKSRCWIGLVPEWSMPAEVDTMLRATGARNQVGDGLVQAMS